MSWQQMGAEWTKIGAIGQWVGAIGTFLAVATALFIAFLPSLQNWRRRPKLLLGFDNDRDVKSQSKTVSHPDGQNSRWLRVMVTNAKGRRPAKNCRAYLTGIRRDGADEFPNDVRQLFWTHDPSNLPQPRDLLAEVNHWIDLLAAIENVEDVQVRTYPPYAVEAGAEYVFTVQVTAEDAEPEMIRVRANLRGSWSALSGKQVR